MKGSRIKVRGSRSSLRSVLKRSSSMFRPHSGTRRASRTRTRTATRTRTKRKTQQYIVDDRAGSITSYDRYQKSNIPRTMLKALKGLQPMIMNRNDKVIWTSLTGLQEYQDITYLSPQNINDMITQGIASLGLSTANLFTSGQGLGTTDLYIMSMKATLRYTNLSNGVLEFDLMDWVARRDVYTDHANNAASPKDCFVTGVGDQTTALTGQSTQYQVVGVTPFASKLFTMNYNVKRSRKVVLAPGQQHIHNVTLKPWFRINYELANNNNLFAVKKLTSGTSLLYKGAVIKDSTGGATFAPAEIGVIATYQYKFKLVPVNWRREYITNSLSNTAAATNIENLVTGVASTYATV